LYISHHGCASPPPTALMDPSISSDLGHAAPSFTKKWRKFKAKFSRRSKRVSKPEVKLSSKTITFHHAGYDPEYHNTVIFRLRGCEQYSGGVRASTPWLLITMLVDHDTLDRLHFSTKRGGRAVRFNEAAHLIRSHYFIHCRDPDDGANILYQFPLIASFSFWSVPTQKPSIWEYRGHAGRETTHSVINAVYNREGLDFAARCNEAIVQRDRRCILSEEFPSSCHRAFLVPNEQRDFWRRERMAEYLGFRTAQNVPLHPRNGILLRTDICRAYENGDFVFLPVDDHWVAHFFNPMSELARQRDKGGLLFDQKRIRLSEELPRHFLMVRVAITAFALARDFLEQDEYRAPRPSRRLSAGPSELASAGLSD
jgi:hypothetical protein